MGKKLRQRGRASKLDAYLDQIGKRPDEDIAKDAGCSAANVYMFRRRHNIELKPEILVAPEKKGRASVLDRHRHLIGKLSDAEVAQLAGCTPSNVSAFRRKHGIVAPSGDSSSAAAQPAAAPVASAPAKGRGRPPKVAAAPVPAPVVAEAAPVAVATPERAGRPSVLDRHRHLIGKLSDKEVAQLAGCTPSNVSAFRRKYGIVVPEAETASPAPAPAPAPTPVASEPVKVKARQGRPPKVAAPVAAPVVEAAVVAPAPVAVVPAPVAAPKVAAPAENPSGYLYTIDLEINGQRQMRGVVAANLVDAMNQAVKAERNGARVLAVRLHAEML